MHKSRLLVIVKPITHVHTYTWIDLCALYNAANPQPNRQYFILTPRATNDDGTDFDYGIENGLGEWMVHDAAVEVLDGGQVIGFRSTFQFEYPQNYVGVQHIWTMTQFSLHQDPNQDAQQNTALCIIQRDWSFKVKFVCFNGAWKLLCLVCQKFLYKCESRRVLPMYLNPIQIKMCLII